MSQGLPVSDVVNVQIVMSPIAAGLRNFGALLIVGSSNVIDVNERIRPYATIDQVAADFGSTAPEYLAARDFFSQQPRPNLVYIGRWAQTATSAVLRGAILTPAQQTLATFKAITAGTMTITVNGTPVPVTALNLSAINNLNAAATALQAKITGTTVTWDAVNSRFNIATTTTGAAATITTGAPTTGADVSALFGLQAGQGAVPVGGVVAEAPDAAMITLAQQNGDWYGSMFAVSTPLTDDQNVAVAAYIESASTTRIYGITVTATTALDPTNTSDLPSRLKALGYKRTFWLYCSSDPYGVASVFGRAFTVDFQGSNTTITLKFKQLPGIAPENLTENQAMAIKGKNGNVFVRYNNDTAIIQEGVMVNGYFFDEVHGTDWLQNDVQTAVFNRLYTSTTKVPQTDPGVTDLISVIEARLEQAVVNGLVAPGVWTADGFGLLNTGDTLSKGYYTYAPAVATQPQSIREQRIAPTIQVAIKLAGAIHFVNVIINVNR